MITTDYNLPDLYEYYSHYLVDKTNLVLLSKDDFHKKLIDRKITFVSNEKDINGFLSCCLENKKAYINLVFGKKSIQRELLLTLERYLMDIGIKEIWIHFFNPIKLAWRPKVNVVHPAIQGVVKGSELHNLYLNLGYKNNSYQQTYYQELVDFDIKDYRYKITDIKVEFYNANKHQGLNDFVKSFGVKVWQDEIINNENQNYPLPLLVALDQNKVIGFSGPIKVEDNFRGYFAGIGVLKSYRSRGIGKLLFLRLCQELKNIKAKYMTFFTGSLNPARFIYLNTGFKVIETFVTMKKNITRR